MASVDEKNGSRMAQGSSIDEKSRSRKPHFFSRSLSRGNFSWSFVRSALQPANRNSGLSPSTSSCNSEEFTTNARLSDSGSFSDVSSDACSISSSSTATSGSSSSHTKRTAGAPVKRKVSKHSSGERRPVLVDKIPFGKSSQYLTVYVGPRIDESVKYVISRKLLAHPLFQVLLKCSEDEFGEDFSVDKGVAIVCDPALFLQVVRAVDDSLWHAQQADAEDAYSCHASDA